MQNMAMGDNTVELKEKENTTSAVSNTLFPIL